MELMAYLRHAGWTLSRRDERWAVYSRGDIGQPAEIEVPQLALASDYARCVEMLLTDLELVERRPAFEILRDIEAVASELRARAPARDFRDPWPHRPPREP